MVLSLLLIPFFLPSLYSAISHKTVNFWLWMTHIFNVLLFDHSTQCICFPYFQFGSVKFTNSRQGNNKGIACCTSAFFCTVHLNVTMDLPAAQPSKNVLSFDGCCHILVLPVLCCFQRKYRRKLRGCIFQLIEPIGRGKRRE